MRYGMSAEPIYFLKLRILPLDFTCSLLEQVKINAKKYALRTYPKRLVPHQKTFDLEISQIDHGRRFRSSGNGAWSICFETSHADALSWSLGTLNVKGSIGGGDFAAQ